jgi:DNA polymerase III psi subunit
MEWPQTNAIECPAQTLQQIQALLVVTMGNAGADPGDRLVVNSQGDAGLNATAPWQYWYLTEHALTSPTLQVCHSPALAQFCRRAIAACI